MIKLLCEQRSEAWYQARIARVTGTSFSDLVAKKDTTGHQSLISNIACEIITETQEDIENYVNSDMQRGIDSEPLAKKQYKELFDCELTDVGFVIPDEDNEFNEWIGVSPDALINDDGLLEIKCPLRKTHISYIEKNALPSNYKHQVQGQLFVTGLAYCDFMSFCEGMKPFIVRVFPDLDLHELYKTELRELIKQVRAKIETYNKYSHE